MALTRAALASISPATAREPCWETPSTSIMDAHILRASASMWRICSIRLGGLPLGNCTEKSAPCGTTTHGWPSPNRSSWDSSPPRLALPAPGPSRTTTTPVLRWLIWYCWRRIVLSSS